MLKVTDLTRRDIINLSDGAKLGAIKDMHIDPSTGAIKAFVLQGPKKYGVLSAGRDVVVPWEKIKKIGVDAVLVELDTFHNLNYQSGL
jgi:sporulation protein, YlmC/YmxH family